MGAEDQLSVAGAVPWPVLLGMSSVVSLSYYVLVARTMFIEAPPEGAGPVRLPGQYAGLQTACAAFTLALGVYRSPPYDFVQSSIEPVTEAS